MTFEEGEQPKSSDQLPEEAPAEQVSDDVDDERDKGESSGERARRTGGEAQEGAPATGNPADDPESD